MFTSSVGINRTKFGVHLPDIFLLASLCCAGPVDVISPCACKIIIENYIFISHFVVIISLRLTSNVVGLIAAYSSL